MKQTFPTCIMLLSAWILSGLLSACRGGPDPSAIPIHRVVRGDLRISVVESGELKARRSQVITAPRTSFGQIQIVEMVEEGTQVEEGDFVIQFDSTEPEKTISERKAELDLVRADLVKIRSDQVSRIKDLEHQLANQEASLELATIKQERMRFEAETRRREAELELTQARLAVEQARQKIETQRATDIQEIRKQELTIRQTERRLESAQRDAARLRVDAPGSGLVVYRENWATDAKIRIGDNAWPGMPLIEIPDLSQMVAETQINELDVSKIQEGLETLVTLDAFPDRVLGGEVLDVATLASEKGRGSGVKVFTVQALLDETDPIMKPGMTVKVEIVVERLTDVLSVPLEAVFTEKGETLCHRKRNGSFEPRRVVLGRRSNDFVEVVEGLEPGDEVALLDPTVPLEAIGAPTAGAAESTRADGTGS